MQILWYLCTQILWYQVPKPLELAALLYMTRMTLSESSKLTSVACLSQALLLSKSHEGVQKQTDIPEGQDRSCDCDLPLYPEGQQPGEAESLLISQNGVLGGQTISPTLFHYLNCLADAWHTSYHFLNNAGHRMCRCDTRRPQAILQSQRTDTKLSNRLQLYLVKNF